MNYTDCVSCFGESRWIYKSKAMRFRDLLQVLLERKAHWTHNITGKTDDTIQGR